MICISTDTDEELSELKTILEESNIDHISFTPKSRKNRPEPRTIYKVITKIIETVELIRTIKKNNVTILLGGPCIKNRAARIFTNVKYGSYIRSLHPDSQNASSLSDKIYFTLKKIGINNLLFNPYYADICLISTPINSKFLQARNIPLQNIKSIGAVWLEHEKKITLTREPQRLFYLTQAYKEHNKPDAHDEQIEIIRKLIKISSATNTKLVIRRHPRDKCDYENIFKIPGLSINSSSPQDFLYQLNKQDTIISSFSTMAFEISHLGGNVKFITLNSVASYDMAFSDLNIKPTYWRDLPTEQINSFSENKNKVFFDYSTLHLKEFCKKA